MMTKSETLGVSKLRPNMTGETSAQDRGVVYGDPERTRRLILDAATKEFAEHGFGGGRTDRIALEAKVNKQAMYYHFGNKDALFSAVLEDVYQRFYNGYARVGPRGLSPDEQFRALLNNLFDVVVANRDIFLILLDENRMKGRHLPNVTVRKTARELIRTIERLLVAGKKQGIFREEVDAKHLWMSIVALCIFNVTHLFTVNNILASDISTRQALNERKAHVIAFVMSAITVS